MNNAPNETVNPSAHAASAKAMTTLGARTWLLTFLYFTTQAALLFGSAGTVAWPNAWTFLAIQAVSVVAVLTGGDRNMLAVRSTWEANARRWDLLLAPLSAGLFWIVPLVVAGLDAGRFHWSPRLPSWMTFLAFILHAIGMAISVWAMISNPFFAKFVAVGQSPEHFAVARGPYAYVRHPGYSGATFAFGALPLALGSIWAFVPAVLGLALLIVRTTWEDDTLQQELPGYPQYAGRVQWRFVPYIW